MNNTILRKKKHKLDYGNRKNISSSKIKKNKSEIF